MAETFPVKPKLRPTSSKITPTPESKYWRSFKIPKDIETTPSKSFTFPINSIAFSPVDPHDFAATHSANISIFSGKSLEPKPKISDFSDTAAAASFRCDGKLLAAGDLTGTVHVFDAKSRSHLRRLKGHTAAVRSVCYPRAADKIHLFSGGDDSVVKYWDVTTEKCVFNLLGHKDYVRCGDASPISDEMFVSGSYDHRARLWDVRVSNAGSVMELNHEKPVESVIYLPSGGLVATAGGNFVKIWDVIGGGKLLYSMESHIKTVTALCMGKVARGSGDEAVEYRILSVGLDGYMKVFDYAKFKITHSMRFPEPLLSVGVSPDCLTRVIGTSKGNLYIGRRKAKAEIEDVGGRGMEWKIVADEPERKVLRPSYFRYFQRGQNIKPSEGDYLIKRPKKVKMAEFDKMLKKFRHREALVAALNKRNPESVVAVIEELVARKKLMKCVSNLDMEELGLLLAFLQRYSTVPRYAGLLTRLANKVVELRAEDIQSSDQLRNYVRNLKRDVEEEIRIQQSLLEIQGIISPMLRIAARSHSSKRERERERERIMGGMSMVTPKGGCVGKSPKSAAAEEEEKQLSYINFILSALRKSMVSTCRADEQDEEAISTVHDMEIGWPTNVEHLTHVTFDRFHGFLGLPLEFEVEIPCKAPSASVSVCGVSADSMKWSYDARCNSVPTILLLMQEKLYALGGLKAEGIFRINPENTKEEDVREHLNKGIVPDEIDVHCLASLIKAWFRELPSGVLDGLSPQQVLQCDAEEDCVELVEQLRPTERCLLGWAVDLMADVVEAEESNKMSARNIAMVFAPNMTKMSDPLTALMHAVQVTNLLKTLIVRRVRERREAATGDAPASPRSSDGKKHKNLDDQDECKSDDDDEGLLSYSPNSEYKYESDSLSDIEYCFSRQLDEHDSAKDGFRRQLERILCRDQSSPMNGGSALQADSGFSFSESRIGSSSTSTSDDEGSRSRSRSASSKIAKNSRFY